MTVRVCDVTFADWISLPLEGMRSDTFIFRVSAQACIPPFAYAPLLRRIIAQVRRKRSCASIWVQVDAPGQWFGIAVHHALKGLRLPFVVTSPGEAVDYIKFSAPPKLFYSPLARPPVVVEAPSPITPEQLMCLQALGRMSKGCSDEIVSLTGLSLGVTSATLGSLQAMDLVDYKRKRLGGRSKLTQLDLFPLWHPTTKGLAVVLRSWGVPKGIDFTARLEKNRRQIGYGHRHLARLWPAWLKAAWPQAEIWTGYSEVRIPGTSVIPDGLAWGKVHGRETLFWLEVGDGHKSRKEIQAATQKRLKAAMKLSKETGMWLVYVQLSTPWVHDAMARACVELPEWAAVVVGNHRQFGELPILGWGKVTSN